MENLFEFVNDGLLNYIKGPTAVLGAVFLAILAATIVFVVREVKNDLS